MDEEIKNAQYMWQLGRVLEYLRTAPEQYRRLVEEDRKDLERYFPLDNLPNPDKIDDAAERVLSHRAKIEADDLAISDRVAAIIERLDDAAGGFSYLGLRKRVVEHMADHGMSFRQLRERDLRALDRYFLFVGGPGASTDEALEAALEHSRDIEMREPGIRKRVMNILAKVDDFET